MRTLDELGQAVAERRRAVRMTQADVSSRAGITSDTLSRFELGKASDLGARKLLAVLSVLGLELEFKEEGTSGSLDELRKEHRVRR